MDDDTPSTTEEKTCDPGDEDTSIIDVDAAPVELATFRMPPGTSGLSFARCCGRVVKYQAGPDGLFDADVTDLGPLLSAGCIRA